MSARLVPVVRVPSCARGPPRVFVYCTCTTELYCTTGLQVHKNDDDHERTPVEIPFKIKDSAGLSLVNRS